MQIANIGICKFEFVTPLYYYVFFYQYTCLGKTTYKRGSSNGKIDLFNLTDEQIEAMIIECSAELLAEYQHQQMLTSPQKISRITAVNRLLASCGGYGGGGAAASYGSRDGNGDSNRDGDGTATEGEDLFAAIALSPEGDRLIQSQDSLAGDYYTDYYDNEASRDAFSVLGGEGASNGFLGLKSVPQVLVKGDIIVDKMHIHYGKKDKNPVENMRFYHKDADPLKDVAKRVDESVYETMLPRTFEELAVRVFCRYKHKDISAAAAFKRFCDKVKTHQPFPSQSQQLVDDISFEEDDGADDADAEMGGLGA